MLWLVVALVGFAAASIAYARSKEGPVRASGFIGARLSSLVAGGVAAVNRFVFAPAIDIADRAGEWIPAADGAVGRAAIASGRYAAATSRAPVLPLMIVLAVALAVLIGVLSPGVFR